MNVTFREIVTRYKAGENAFDLTVEKWVRIRESLEKTFTLSRFKEILDAASIKVPLACNIRIIVPYVLYGLFAARDRKDHSGNSYG